MATIAEIQQLYTIYLGRPADPDGLDFWLSKPLSALQIANAFGSTPEYQARLQNLGTSGAINQIYLNCFGRSPDAAGLQFWTQKVQTGEISLSTAGFIIANNASPADQVIINNKQSSATLYTSSIRQSTQSVLAYTTNSGLASGVSFLTGITTTPATAAQASAAVSTMTTNAGGGTGGLTFNQIAQNAVLTSGANTNNAGTGPGFTPSASTLTNANDIIKLGVFGGATIQDGFTTDNDLLLLDAAGFNQSLAAMAGIETITFNGAASFSATNTIGGVNTVNFLQGGELFAGATITSAFYNIATTGAVQIGSAAGSLSAFDAALSAANGGLLTLNAASTAVNIVSFSGNNNYTISQGNNGGNLNFFAGAGTTAFTLTLAGAGVYTSSVFSGGGDFNVIAVGNLGKLAGSSNVFNFAGSAGTKTYTLQNNAGAGAAEVISLSSFTGLDVISRVATASVTNANAANNTYSASFNLKSNAVTLSFFTAALTQNILGTGLINSQFAIQAVNAGTANEVVNLNLNGSGSANGGNGFSIVSGITIITNGVTGTAANASAAFNTLNLNVFNTTALSLTNPVAYTGAANAIILDTLTTFNLATTAEVSASIVQGAKGYSSLSTFGFSQADNGVTFLYGTGVSAGGTISVYGGSGNDILSFANSQASFSAANFAVSAVAASSYNFVDLADGGNDSIVSLRSDVANNNSGYTYNRIRSFGVGDVLTFTQAAFAGGLQTIAGNNVNLVAAAVNLYFDGTDTYVGALTGANGGNLQFGNMVNGTAYVVKLEGVNYTDVTRWSLVNGSLRLIA